MTASLVFNFAISYVTASVAAYWGIAAHLAYDVFLIVDLSKGVGFGVGIGLGLRNICQGCFKTTKVTNLHTE